MSSAIGFTKAVSLALAGIVLAVSVAGPSPAASASAELARTRQEITEIRKRLAAAQGRSAAIKKEVGLLDAQLGTLNKQIVAGQKDISALESGIRTAQVQIGEAEARYGTAAKASNERARRLYISGPSQSVAILFSAESVKELTRAQFWMEKTAEVDSKIIIDASRLKSDLLERQQQLSKIKSNLDAQKSALQKRKGLAAAALGDRNKALGAVEKEIAEAKEHVQGLEADSQRLTEVLKQRASKPAPGQPMDRTPPAKGEPLRRRGLSGRCRGRSPHRLVPDGAGCTAELIWMGIPVIRFGLPRAEPFWASLAGAAMASARSSTTVMAPPVFMHT